MKLRNKVPGMPGWTDIGSDVSWDDYGGKWARRARDGSWYVVDFWQHVSDGFAAVRMTALQADDADEDAR